MYRKLLLLPLSLITIGIQAQNVGIGTNNPDPSAKLDISAADKGVLLPQVELTGTSDALTITNPAQGLLVWNKGTGGLSPAGFYVNIGTPAAPNWVPLVQGNITADNGANISSGNNVQLGGSLLSNTNIPLNSQNLTFSGKGSIGIGTASPTANTMLSIVAHGTNSYRNGIDITMTSPGTNATGININASTVQARGFTYNNSSSSTNNSVWGTGAALSSANIVSGYTAYRTGSGISYGLYGVNGLTGSYATNANTWALFAQGRAVISSELSPTAPLGTDLEVRNTTGGAGNPATIALRQTASNSTSGSILANLSFGDNYATGAQAQIQVLRGAAGGASDLPTDMSFLTTPDGSATPQEQMRIRNNGNIAINSLAGIGNRAVYADANGNLMATGTAGVVSGSGTLNSIPKWTPDGATLGNSTITDNGTDVLLMPSGKVGIGTTSPNAKLTIVDTENAAFAVYEYGNTDGANLRGYRAQGTPSAPAALVNGDVLARLSGIGHNGTSFSGAKAQVSFETTQDWNTTAQGTRLVFSNTANNSTTLQERMRIDQNGNMGIGTTSPLAKVTARESESSSLTTFTQNVSTAGLLITTNYTANAYTPGLFWSTDNDNKTKPKAGIFVKETGNGTHLLFGTSNSYITGITNTAIDIDPSANVEVAGMLRGKAVYSTSSSSTTTYNSSNSDVYNSDIATTIYLRKDDIVKVDLAGNLLNSSGYTTYMRVTNASGSGTWLQPSNWITCTGSGWKGGYSTGLFQASADGYVTFQAIWHVDYGTGSSVYSNITAVVIGRY